MSTRCLPTHWTPRLDGTWAPILLIFALNLTPSAGAPAGGATCTATKATSGAHVETIGVHASLDVPAGTLQQAFEIWDHCRDFGFEMPEFSNGAMTSQRLVVRYHRAGKIVGHCGMIQGSLVTVFAFAYDERGKAFSCGPPAVVLAHEIGHFLGLLDSPAHRACRNHLMAAVPPHNAGERTVDREICAAVNTLWQAALESPRQRGLDGPSIRSAADQRE